MSRIRPFRRFNQDDYRGAPDWFFDFLDQINPMIDTLNPLLQSNVDIDNNLLAERQTVTLSHATPITIKLQKLTIRPSLVRVGYAEGYIGIGGITGYNSDGTVETTVYFQGTAPTKPVLTVLVFEP